MPLLKCLCPLLSRRHRNSWEWPHSWETSYHDSLTFLHSLRADQEWSYVNLECHTALFWCKTTIHFESQCLTNRHGTAILQNDESVTYVSKTLMTTECIYANRERERESESCYLWWLDVNAFIYKYMATNLHIIWSKDPQADHLKESC